MKLFVMTIRVTFWYSKQNYSSSMLLDNSSLKVIKPSFLHLLFLWRNYFVLKENILLWSLKYLLAFCLNIHVEKLSCILYNANIQVDRTSIPFSRFFELSIMFHYFLVKVASLRNGINLRGFLDLRNLTNYVKTVTSNG